ncbi:T9SS type A sorting domain-containing protein [candidate division KSB1 bacterium]|nr:T9SS type A sorting domain-containing protein [candidate division KSB1 bacterium]
MKRLLIRFKMMCAILILTVIFPGFIAKSVSQTLGLIIPDARVDETVSRSWGSHAPAIATNPEHLNYMIVWVDEPYQSITKVYGKIFAPNGDAMTSEFQVDQCPDTIACVYSTIDIAVDPAGNFWVIWDDRRNYPDIQIYARVFARTGKALSNEFVIGTSPEVGGIVHQPAIGISPQNTILLAWVNEFQGQIDIYCRFLQIVNNAETNVLSEFVLNDGNQRKTRSANQPRIAVSAEGNFVAAWRDNRYSYEDTGISMIYGRRFHYSGKALGAVFLVNQWVPQTWVSFSDPDVAVDESNNLIFTWHDGRFYDNMRSYYVFFRKFSWEEEPLTGDITVAACNILSRPGIATDNDSKFVIQYSRRSFTKADPDTAFDHIFARQFSSKNDSIDGEWCIDQGGTVQFNTEHAHVFNHANLMISAWTANRLRMPQENFTGYVYQNIFGIPLPDPPFDLQPDSVGTDYVQWRWRDNSNNETYFVVKDDANNVVSPYLNPNTQSWTETGLSPNLLVRRKVVAGNTSGESAASKLISVFTLAETPTNLRASSVTDSTIDLVWTCPNAARFAVQKALDTNGQPGVYQVVATWGDSLFDTAYQDRDVKPITAYWYRVSAYNGDQILSAASKAVRIVTGDAVMIPPSDLIGKSSSPTTILWKWQDNSNNESNFYLENESGEIVSGNLAPNSTSWLETGLLANVAYARRVRGTSTTGVVCDPSKEHTACTLANPPSDLVVADTTSSSVLLRWSGNGATQFEIDRALDNGGVPGEWVSLKGWDAAWTNTAFSDSNLSENTLYWYRVKSFNQHNEINEEGAVIKIKTLAFEAPSNFTGTARSTTSIEWSWRDNTNEEKAYVLYLSENDSILLSDNAEAWLETGLLANTQYVRYVRALALNGRLSGPSNADTVYTLANPPTNFRAVDTTSTSVVLQWQGHGASRFYITRADFGSASPESMQVIVDWNDNVTENFYTDSGLKPASTYMYRVYGYNGDQMLTEPSNMVTVTTPFSVINPPTNLIGGARSTTEIEWKWMDNTDQETGYVILDSLGNAIVTLPADQTSWIETGLAINTRYKRQVVAQSTSGEMSGGSNYAAVYTLADAPANLRATDSTSTSISLQWNASKAFRYAIERAYTYQDQYHDWEFIILWENKLINASFTETGLLPDAMYWYRVMGFNGDKILTEASNIISVTTLSSIITPPTNLTAFARSTSSIEWQWRDNTELETGYVIFDSAGTQLAELPANQIEWRETDLAVNTRYSRQVFARSASGDLSGGSNRRAAYTLAQIPSGLTFSRSGNSINLSWNGYGGTRFAVERALNYENEPGEWLLLVDWEGNVSEPDYTDSPSDSDAGYWYRVRAYNGDRILTEPSESLLVLPSQAEPLIGDIVIDAAINLADLDRLVQIILEQGPEATQYETKAADCYADGQINIHDVIWIVNEILNIPMSFEPETHTASRDGVQLEFLGTMISPTGETRIPVALNSAMPVKSLQLQIDHSAHIEIKSVQAHCNDSELTIASHQNGTQTRILIYSMNNTILPPGRCDLFSLTIAPSNKSGLTDAVELAISAGLALTSKNKLVRASSPESRFGVMNASVPNKFVLNQNFPNPFNSETAIVFQCPQNAGKVSLVLYDIMGQSIATLYNSKADAGTVRIKWDGKDRLGRDVASGIYFYELHATDFRDTKKLLLIR